MPRGTTTEQGYGWEHQKIRARLLRDHIDGTLCDRCWQPMHRSQRLDAAHPHDKPRGLYDSKADHLEHAVCNQTGLITPPPTTELRTSRDW